MFAGSGFGEQAVGAGQLEENLSATQSQHIQQWSNKQATRGLQACCKFRDMGSCKYDDHCTSAHATRGAGAEGGGGRSGGAASDGGGGVASGGRRAAVPQAVGGR